MRTAISTLFLSTAFVAKLGKGEATAIADFRIVHAELVSVVTECQRLGQVVGQRLESAEMARPGISVEIESDAFDPSRVDETRSAFGEARRPDRVVKIGSKGQELRIGLVGLHLTPNWRWQASSASPLRTWQTL